MRQHECPVHGSDVAVIGCTGCIGPRKWRSDQKVQRETFIRQWSERQERAQLAKYDPWREGR